MWWDEETDGELMYPPRAAISDGRGSRSSRRCANPDETAARGLWSDPEFLANLTDLNAARGTRSSPISTATAGCFARCSRRTAQGNLLDHRGEIVEPVTNDKLQAAVATPARMKEPYRDTEQRPPKRSSSKRPLASSRDDMPVHLMDIHLEKGMHCVDCHFVQDEHGNTKLLWRSAGGDRNSVHRLPRHGRRNVPTLRTTGPAAYTSGQTETDGRNLDSAAHALRQAAASSGEGEQALPELDGRDRICAGKSCRRPTRSTPGSEHYNVKSHMAKTVRDSTATTASSIGAACRRAERQVRPSERAA